MADPTGTPTDPERIGRKDRWELYLKVLGIVLTVPGILLAVWQFTRGNVEAKEMEFKRSMYARKLAAYEHLGAAVGAVLNLHRDEQVYINDGDTLAFDSCMSAFRLLYWGVLPLVEDSVVENYMVRFKDEARYYRRGDDKYEDLMRVGLSLMDVCQRSLAEHWKEKKEHERQRHGWLRPGRFRGGYGP